MCKEEDEDEIVNVSYSILYAGLASRLGLTNLGFEPLENYF